jgi:DNA repair photolyase
MQKAGESHRQVLLCFTCDPYQSLDVRLAHTREAIKLLHKHDFSVGTLTKGGRRALRDLDLFGPRDAFATTLTLLDPAESAKWEPGAASPEDRIATIKAFHAFGVRTWVSLEPVLDPVVACEIIRQTHPFVDLYKVGKINYHPLSQSTNWAKFARIATDLLDQLGKRYYVKNDLATYLPGGQAPRAMTHRQLEEWSVTG